jgi:2-polyprenyl-6-methoxyphenol hydroxylase-like FAD-dependent oxidoreductase
MMSAAIKGLRRRTEVQEDRMTHAAPSTGGRTVLISGAGITGLTLAYWLHRYGWRPTIVEQAPGPRAGGYGIDFAGSGWDVAERMGIVPELRRRANRLSWICLKDRRGGTAARTPAASFFRAFDERLVQIMRPELEAVLGEALGDRVTIRYSTSLRRLAQAPDHVAAQFQDGSSAAYDIVVGADGVHSNVRRLIFGDPAPFRVDLGYAFATFPVPALGELADTATIYLEPGRQAMTYPDSRGEAVALLVYRAAEGASTPPPAGKAELLRRYKGAGWLVPAMIESIGEDTPLYMDTTTQIHMPRWSEGRVVLAGDAAHCLTLISGQGASTAMGGAYILAEELGTRTDHRAAFAAYERRVRPFVAVQQRRARRFASTFVPGSPLGVQISRALMRLLLTPPLAPVIGRHFGIDSLLRPA